MQGLEIYLSLAETYGECENVSRDCLATVYATGGQAPECF